MVFIENLVEQKVVDDQLVYTWDDDTNKWGVYIVAATPEASIVSPVGRWAIDRTNGKFYRKDTGAGNTGWTEFIVGGPGATNLASGAVDATTYEITSDTGNNVVIQPATGTLAGVMPSADKVKADFITVTGAVDLDNIVLTVTVGTAGSPASGAITVPTATDAIEGLVELSTLAETLTGTAVDRVNTPAGLRGVVKEYEVTYGNAVSTSFTITHNLGTTSVQVEVQYDATGEVILPNITSKTTNTVVIQHDIAPALNEFRAVVYMVK